MGEAVAARLTGSRRMIVADQNEAAAARVAAALGGEVEPAVCDITDTAACDALASMVGSLGALVVTAGLSPTMGTPDRIMEVNLAGSARLLAALDGVVGEGTAAVIFASSAAHVAFPFPLRFWLCSTTRSHPTCPAASVPPASRSPIRASRTCSRSWA